MAACGFGGLILCSRSHWPGGGRTRVLVSRQPVHRVCRAGQVAEDGSIRQTAQIVCKVAQSHGGTWNRDGVIVLPLSLTSGLFQVSASGGVPVPLGRANAAGPPPQQIQPEFLPDGRHFMYWEMTREHTGIYVGSLDGAPPLRLFPQNNSSDSNATYVPAAAPGQDGYLLFRRGETLMAQRFNPTRLSLSGECFSYCRTDRGSVLWAAFSISENGTLVYASTGGASAVQQLAWWDRTASR